MIALWTKRTWNATNQQPPSVLPGGYFYGTYSAWEISKSPCPRMRPIEILGVNRREIGGEVFKRFTDCHKWQDSWYRKLPVEYKLLWNYICDNCDNSGVWKVDMETAGYFIGHLVNEETGLAYLKTRITVLAQEYWLINKFVSFQYGELSHKSPPHIAVFKLIERHTLTLPYPYPSTRVEDKDKEDVEVKKLEEGMGETKRKVLEWFEKTWDFYPKERRVGKAAALRSYKKRVKTKEDAQWFGNALESYLKSKTVKDGFIKNASTFFANVEDYAEDRGKYDERRDLQRVANAQVDSGPTQSNTRRGGFVSASRVVDDLRNQAPIEPEPDPDL